VQQGRGWSSDDDLRLAGWPKVKGSELTDASWSEIASFFLFNCGKPFSIPACQARARWLAKKAHTREKERLRRRARKAHRKRLARQADDGIVEDDPEFAVGRGPLG